MGVLAAIRGMVGKWRLRIWVALAIALGVGVGQVPLFGTLGLELATVAALFAAVASLDLGRAFAAELQRMPAIGIARADWPARSVARLALGAAGLAVAVAAIPGAIAAVRGIWTTTCDWSFGVLAYVAMPLATALLGGATGFAIGTLVGPRRYAGAAAAQVPLVLVAAGALWRFYAAPAVFTYNAVLGYFPGNLYDEKIDLGMPLLWSRLEQLLCVVALLAIVAMLIDVPTVRARVAARPAGRRWRCGGAATVAAALAVTLRLHGGDLGYAPDASDLQAALGGRIETEHFVIYYAKTPDIEADIELIAADHEYRYAQVVAVLGAAPAGKLRSYYFASRDQKARLMGARNVEMAKPWRREIYIEHRTFPHNSLRHEIAHAIASAFGDPIFGVAARRILGLPLLFSPGLIEGLAVAADWPGSYDRLTPHESARAMLKLGNLPSLDTLLGIGFFTSSSSERSYAAAGSFLRFLLDQHGAAPLRALYESGGDFEGAYGAPRSQLEARWLAMLASVDLPQATVDASQERFRGGGLLSKPCPHAIAAKKERADATSDRERKIELLADVCSDAPDEPRYHLDLADALYGSDHPLDRARAVGMWLRLALNPYLATTSIRAQAYQRLARAAYTAGKVAEARGHITALLALSIDPAERRTPEGMAFALDRDSAGGPALREYFFVDASFATAEKIVAAEPDLALGHYLVALNAYLRNDWGRAAREFTVALSSELPSRAFVRNAARLLAPAAYRSRDRLGLGIAIAVLSRSEMSSGDRLLAVDWAERGSR